ncbi:MAG: M23 family metallopeptidase [Actinomycetota bacterium]|nr:M23 family metallopeptidase [Actinomycetota bacterium]
MPSLTPTAAPPKPKPKTKPKTKTTQGPRLIFPVVGPVRYTNDFGAPRPQGSHQGNDLMAPKRSIAVAAEDGTVKFAGGGSAGCYLYLYGKSKTTYLYIHLNNDLTKGNDNRGKCVAGTAYAKGLRNGAKVKAGEPVGYVGDSGDANGVASHLHFELHPKGKGAVNPYPYLNRATRLLFAAARGSTFKLALTGTVAASGPDRVELKLTALRAYPGGSRITNVNRTIEIYVPPSVLIERKTKGVVQTVSAPFGALRKKLSIQIWTASAPCTLDAQMGRDGALTADRILLLR